MIGISYFFATFSTSKMADICGTPMPATILVVHIDPGPTPIFTPSVPAFIKASHASGVAMFPAISCISLKFLLVSFMASITFLEWPWAVSITITSHPALRSASILISLSLATPTAAPTRSLPIWSLHALGYFRIFSISLMVIRPLRLKRPSTTKSFSILCLWRMAFDSSKVIFSLTVTRFSFVITFSTVSSRFVSNRKSRFVIIPTSFFPFVTGIPDILYRAISSMASLIFCSGRIVMGSTIIPLSDFLTFSTSWACSSTPIFLWIMPIPPSWAMQIAAFASVTVSIAALRIGMFSLIVLVK